MLLRWLIYACCIYSMGHYSDTYIQGARLALPTTSIDLARPMINDIENS